MDKSLENYILALESGGRPKGGALTSGEIISLGAEHLSGDGNLNLTNLKFIPKEFYKQLNKGKIKSNDILIVKDGATTGKVAFVNGQLIGKEAAINEHLFLLRTSQQLFPKYLFYFLYSKAGQSQILSDFRGSTVGGISRNFIEYINLPIPSLKAQQEIAQLLEQADLALQKRKASKVLTDQFLQSSFLSMFGDLITNGKSWRSEPLDSIALVNSGVTKGRNLNGTVKISVPYMRVANVQDGRLDLSEIKEIEIKEGELDKYLLQSGDILLTEGGDPDKLGRGAVWYNQISNCIHQNHIFRVRVDKKVLSPEFLSFQFGSQYGKQYFLKAAKQTTGIASINSTQLKAFPVLIPPIQHQLKFASIVADAEQLRQKQKQSEIELENLFQALLQKYFG